MHSSLRSPSVDVNIQSTIRENSEEEAGKGIGLGLLHQAAASLAEQKDEMCNNAYRAQRSPGHVVQTHREPISGNNTQMGTIRISRPEDHAGVDDFSHRRRHLVNQTEQRAARPGMKRDLDLEKRPAQMAPGAGPHDVGLRGELKN